MTPEQFFAAARHDPPPAAPCVATADRWVESCAGLSVIAAGGLVVATADDADALLRQTSLPRLIARCMKAAGFAMTRQPQTGDVGAIVAGNKVVCAVRGERMWLYRSDDGFGASPLDARVIGAWRIA